MVSIARSERENTNTNHQIFIYLVFSMSQKCEKMINDLYFISGL
jgi:hypothetical protein